MFQAASISTQPKNSKQEFEISKVDFNYIPATGICFKATDPPATIVDGVVHKHNFRECLAEPLRQGIINWANFQRRRSGQRPRPTDEADNIYNNRTLRFWRMATDYSRFSYYHDGGGTTKEKKSDNSGLQFAIDEDEEKEPVVFWTSPQRPYSCPPHQLYYPTNHETTPRSQ